MLKKLILIQLAVVFLFLACKETPFIPPIQVEMNLEYFQNGRIINSTIKGVKIVCPWEGPQYHDMKELEEGHYIYQARQVEAPAYGRTEYKISVTDRGYPCTEGVYANGKKLTRKVIELGVTYLLFWIDSKGETITDP